MIAHVLINWFADKKHDRAKRVTSLKAKCKDFVQLGRSAGPIM